MLNMFFQTRDRLALTIWSGRRWVSCGDYDRPLLQKPSPQSI